MKNIAVTSSAHPSHKDITVISVKGFVDTTTASEFDRAFQSVLADQKFNIVIDLKETNYISSVGWGIFIGEIKRIRGQKGNLFLVAMGPEVTEAYQLLELETILKSFPDVEQAVQKGFGKIKPKKAVGKTSTDPAPMSAQAFEPVPAMEMPQEFLTNSSPRKLGFFERLFKPWKWF